MINFNLDIAQRKILIVGAGNVAKRRLKKILKSSKKYINEVISINELEEICMKNNYEISKETLYT